MKTAKVRRIQRRYDIHTRSGEESSHSFFHQAAADNLVNVLKYYYQGQQVGILCNINFYQTDDPHELGVSPDIAVVKDFSWERAFSERWDNYFVGPCGPPPCVIFEVCSEATSGFDLDQKPKLYAEMGVTEYYAFDPHKRYASYRTRWQEQGPLLGWHYKSPDHYYRVRPENGRMWSEQLDSWLVVDGKLLRLYTRDGQLRLDEAATKDHLL
jgi:Uma2 family endonuclease